MAGEQGAVLGDFKGSGDLKDFPTHGQQMLPLRLFPPSYKIKSILLSPEILFVRLRTLTISLTLQYFDIAQGLQWGKVQEAKCT